MARLIWSPRAASDLKEICEFISQDSEHYAKIFAQKVFSVIEDIPMFPKSGRIVPEFYERTKEERALFYQKYGKYPIGSGD